MAIITFTSDFGYRDAFVGSVKGILLSLNPDAHIVDISHAVEEFNIAHGAYVLGASFRAFPEGTVHMVAVDSEGANAKRYIAIELEGHYFVGADNGLFALLSEYQPKNVVELPANGEALFPARDVLVPAVVALASGKKLTDVGAKSDGVAQLIGRNMRVVDNQIIGSVAHVDRYGNLVTNIKKDVFEKVQNGRSYEISFARESFDEIRKDYRKDEDGDCIILFNSNNYLQVAIIHGNASNLLGMGYDSPVIITFK